MVDAVNLRARTIAHYIVLHSKICLVRYTLVSLVCTVLCVCKLGVAERQLIGHWRIASVMQQLAHSKTTKGVEALIMRLILMQPHM